MRHILNLVGVGWIARKVFYWSGRFNNWLRDGDAFGRNGTGE